MQLKPEQLSTHLRKQLAPVYFISGDDPLRVMESADAVRAAAREQGFTERDVFTAQRGFDWDNLLAQSGNMSLFSERRIIDLRLPTGKPGNEGAAAIVVQLQETTILYTAGSEVPMTQYMVAVCVQQHGIGSRAIRL